MKRLLSGGICAAIGGAALLLSLGGPAQAQMPGGSYQETCRRAGGFGDTLTAVCRRADGSWARTALRGVGSCLGDISNQNGQLACVRGRSEYGWNRYGASRRYGWDRGPRFEGYGSSAPPGYGANDDRGYRSYDRYDYDYGYGR